MALGRWAGEVSRSKWIYHDLPPVSAAVQLCHVPFIMFSSWATQLSQEGACQPPQLRRNHPSQSDQDQQGTQLAHAQALGMNKEIDSVPENPFDLGFCSQVWSLEPFYQNHVPPICGHTSKVCPESTYSHTKPRRHWVVSPMIQERRNSNSDRRLNEDQLTIASYCILVIPKDQKPLVKS